MKTKNKANSLDKTIGRNLRLFCESRGFTQPEVGKLCNVSFQQIQKYQNGTNRLSLSTALKIADGAQVDRDKFLRILITGV